MWGSTLVVDGKVYLGDEDGDVVVLQAGKEKKVLAEMNMGSAVYATLVPAHGTLFLNNRNQLFALASNAGTIGPACGLSLQPTGQGHRRMRLAMLDRLKPESTAESAG